MPPVLNQQQKSEVIKLSRIIDCVFTKKPSEGLDKPPYPGEIGIRIYNEISKEAWQQWLERSVMIINEYQLNSADSDCQKTIEKNMVGFLFGEGQAGSAPEGFNAE